MKTYISTRLIAVLCLTASPAVGNEWNLVTTTQGVKVWNREKPGTSVKEVKISGVIEAPAWRVLKVVTDFDHYEEFMPSTKESRVLRKDGNTVHFYSRVSPPLISDRDYTLELVSSVVPGKDGHFITKFTQANDQGPAERKGVVRVTIVSGYWLMESLDNGKNTLLTYYVFTAPGGAVPDALANEANSRSLPGIIKAIREQVRLPKYECQNGNASNCQDWMTITK